MPRRMSVGKQQVLLNYMPGRTFDFRQTGAIARISKIRGTPRADLNTQIVLNRISSDARAWHPDFRPLLRDDVLAQTNRFVLIEPTEVRAELFPKVFWCEDQTCHRVFDYTRSNRLPSQPCPACHRGRLLQIRWVLVHRCGALRPLSSPQCRNCHSSNDMALDTRGSERISNFRWTCRRCGRTAGMFAGRCRECQWPGDAKTQNLDIEVHRAGRTFYTHSTVLLNVPDRELDAFLNISQWPAIAAARYFGLSQAIDRPLREFGSSGAEASLEPDTGLSGVDLDDLMSRQASGELTPEDLITEMRVLRESRQSLRASSSPAAIGSELIQRSGVSMPVWERAGHEILEALVPLETGRPRDLASLTNDEGFNDGIGAAHNLGVGAVTLVTDFPIITATYGFSRAEYAANQCRLNPFPPDREYGGRIPIYLDEVQADALMIRLDADRVLRWLDRNGLAATLPSGTDSSLSARAYSVSLFDGVPLRETLTAERARQRMVFGLLHTLSHLAVRQAALLCGLERTSLSEYLLPRVLSFAIYCNHRFGATIGALTALFEQSLANWLYAVADARQCVYDPVCQDREGSCHACTHLAETSCRYFNLNLGRSFLFSGADTQLPDLEVGYLDSSLALQ